MERDFLTGLMGLFAAVYGFSSAYYLGLLRKIWRCKDRTAGQAMILRARKVVILEQVGLAALVLTLVLSLVNDNMRTLYGSAPALAKASVFLLSLVATGLLGTVAFLAATRVPGLAKAWSVSSWLSLYEWSDVDGSWKFGGFAANQRIRFRTLLILLLIALVCSFAVIGLASRYAA